MKTCPLKFKVVRYCIQHTPKLVVQGRKKLKIMFCPLYDAVCVQKQTFQLKISKSLEQYFKK